MPAHNSRAIKGFTLIELVIGMVVFAIALSLFVSAIVPLARRSVDPILQVKASELAQSLMSEITAKSFDQQSNRSGGLSRCNELSNPCTASSSLGQDNGETRDNYNDVDDYDGLDQSDGEIVDVMDNNIDLNGVSFYAGYRVQVSVVYDDDMDGIDDAIVGGASYIGNTKLIQITVTTPSGEPFIFSGFRGNY
jgi:MSHA pilin protein MshD